MSKAYIKLLEESVRTELPKFYKNDLLVHDKNIIAELGDNPRFLWVTRECGTHLLPLANHKNLADSSWINACESMSGPNQWYLFENGELSAITVEQARQCKRT